MHGTDNTKTDWREQRRFRALALQQRGWTLMAIAEALGVTQGAVSQWLARAETGGHDALRTRKPSGPPTRLHRGQIEQPPKLLLKGAEAHGILGDIWTRQRIADVIARHFDMRPSLPMISRLMRRIGWTHQRLELHAVQRDDNAIEQWRSTRSGAQKEACREGRTIVFVDESGLYLLPFLAKTYAPAGSTPVAPTEAPVCRPPYTNYRILPLSLCICKPSSPFRWST